MFCGYLLKIDVKWANFCSFPFRNFAPIIKNVAALAKQHMDGQHYYVLLIITDGIITDMPDTTEVKINPTQLRGKS